MLFEIKVEDQGMGIKDEDKNLLFQPFFKTKNKESKDKNSNSHGLGLNIC